MRIVMVWLATVLVLSVVPLQGMVRYSPQNADKVLHFILYTITGILFYTEFLRSRTPAVRQWGLWLALIAASGYGLLMEFVQGILTTYRKFSFVDAEINVMGAAVGLFIFKYVLRLPRARANKN